MKSTRSRRFTLVIALIALVIALHDFTVPHGRGSRREARSSRSTSIARTSPPACAGGDLPVHADVLGVRVRVDPQVRLRKGGFEDALAHRTVRALDRPGRGICRSPSPPSPPPHPLPPPPGPRSGKGRSARIRAIGFARDADLPAVEDQAVREHRPLFRGISFIRSCSIFTGSACR